MEKRKQIVYAPKMKYFAVTIIMVLAMTRDVNTITRLHILVSFMFLKWDISLESKSVDLN